MKTPATPNEDRLVNLLVMGEDSVLPELLALGWTLDLLEDYTKISFSNLR